ncbi:hypothetical protein PIB30_022717 [Stylosanthes scabra]|uniref:Ubiquitin-like protease family profile domain-containing protein n=1 Tax=Stylosanthes scabra TaxID=79078 RepID=A0ABU6Y7K8_9FABA|nr:hypothetical protein [Stylosanthes scabra]
MRYQFTSMRPRTYIDIQVISIMCHILNNEQNEWFEKFVYCVPPEILVRMFEKHGHSWMDNEKNRPHDIATLVNHQEYMVYLNKHKLLMHRFLFAPILCSQHWWLYVLDVEKRDFFVLDSKNIVSPSDERSTMNRFASNILDQRQIWAGAPSIFNEGSCSLLPIYVNIPGQPNETDCGPKVDEFRKQIVAKIVLSKDNEKRMETIRQLNEMRNIRPADVL